MLKSVFLCVLLFSVLPIGVLAQPGDAIFITGKAVNNNGEPASQELLIELVCEGSVVRQTHPAANGTFSFDLGSKNQTSMDSRQANPSIGGRNDNWERGSSLDGGFRTTPSGRLDLTACVVRLSPTSGLYANEISLSQRRTMDNPDIGVLVIDANPEMRAASPKVLLSTLNAPPKAAKSLEKAREELSKEEINYKKAAGELEKAVKEYPQFTEAWTLLGESYSALNEPQKAFDAFSRGAETGEDYVPLYLNLARVNLERSQWKEAGQNADKALGIDPIAPHGLFYKGISSYYLNDFETAEGTLLKLNETGHSQEFPVALLHLGMIHIKQNKIQEAATEFRGYLDYSPGDMVPAERRKQIEAQLESWRNLGLIE